MQTEQQDSLLAFIQGMAELKRTNMRLPDGGLSLEDFLLQHGRFWTGAARPVTVDKKPYKQCYKNSQEMLLFADHLLTYCEGYAIGKVGVPTLHAWLVQIDGAVLDVTWDEPENATYYGIPFKAAYVLKRQLVTAHWLSVLDNYHEQWPLLTGKHKAERAIMPWPAR